MEVGGRGRLYIYRYTVTTRMIFALSRAAMRGSDGQSRKTVSTNHNLFEEKERSAEAVSNRGPSAYQPTALPLGQTGCLPSAHLLRSSYLGPHHSVPFRKQLGVQQVLQTKEAIGCGVGKV